MGESLLERRTYCKRRTKHLNHKTMWIEIKPTRVETDKKYSIEFSDIQELIEKVSNIEKVYKEEASERLRYLLQKHKTHPNEVCTNLTIDVLDTKENSTRINEAVKEFKDVPIDLELYADIKSIKL